MSSPSPSNPAASPEKGSPEYPVSIPQNISDEDIYRDIVESIKRDVEPCVDYNAVINYKRYFGGRHVCVMCGRLGGKDCTIRSQNKEVCSDCDSKIWLCMEDDRRFKFCKGCKNFYSMCSFGDKPLASKCIKCRQRSRRHYSMQKTACTTSSPSTAELTMHSPLGGLHIDTAIANDCDDCEEGPGSGTAQDSDRCTPPITKWRTQSDMPDIDAPANKVASRSRADTWAGRKADSSIRFSPHSPTKTLPELPPIVHALLSPTTALKGADAANDSLLMLSSVLKSELLSPVSVKLTPVTHVMHAPPLLKRKADGSLSLDGCIDSPVKHKKIELVFNQDSSFSSLAVEAETKMTSPNSSSRDVSAPTSTSISDQRWQWDASSNPLMYFATILAEAGSQ